MDGLEPMSRQTPSAEARPCCAVSGGPQVCYTRGGMTLTRERLVALHGRDSIAVSTLQPGLESFASPSGFLAYRHARGYDVVLGLPMCVPGHREELLAGFLEE